MKPAHDIYKCPNCKGLIVRLSFMSANNFGECLFSDGKRIAPMLPNIPTLVKCEKCNNFIWLYKIKEIETRAGFFDFKNSECTDYVKFLTIEDNFKVLSLRIAESKDDIKYVRKQILWAYNDRKRESLNMFNDEDDEENWIRNCKELLCLLDPIDADEKIMMAEINRYLGNFDEAIKIIKSSKKVYNWLKEKFLLECESKNQSVFQLYGEIDYFKEKRIEFLI